MDNTAIGQRFEADDLDAGEMRSAPRFTLLIRAAKLVSLQGEFVCVIRDVSETGISMRLFHALPSDKAFQLSMPGGAAYNVAPVWERDNEAGFEFSEPVDIAKLIHEAGEYPTRGLRLSVCFPVTITSISGKSDAIVENLSQQGARIECDSDYSVDQSLLIESDQYKGARAKVRWRQGSHYGLVFDDTLTLGDFARLTARMQAPALIKD
ncbi:PilZ domain-containing protein [Erythrobacter sp. MTPC3]|uniref:PilZ domain-containing protein n=1 Tax=Erythrobacter sp. MTPC3 TaxID=3056564 RepID=UPI0036F3AF1F